MTLVKLSHHLYGKARIRLLKVIRAGAQHSLKELEVQVMLHGEFESSYTAGDNRQVVATDTMKNTVHVLAQQKLGMENEDFAAVLAAYFLSSYAQVQRAEIHLSEHRWDRITAAGRAHEHSFQDGGSARPTVEVLATREKTVIKSGIDKLLILKSTGSGFEKFHRDAFTTLPETQDRIFATQLTAVWEYARAPRNYTEANRVALEAMLRVFAENYSHSVQTTLFEMGEAALQAVPEVTRVHLSMPNKHCLSINLAPFGLENKNELFLPTDEPHGLIEGTVER